MANPQDTLNAAFPSPSINDAAIDSATGEVWVWNGSLWVNIGLPLENEFIGFSGGLTQTGPVFEIIEEVDFSAKAVIGFEKRGYDTLQALEHEQVFIYRPVIEFSISTSITVIEPAEITLSAFQDLTPAQGVAISVNDVGTVDISSPQNVSVIAVLAVAITVPAPAQIDLSAEQNVVIEVLVPVTQITSPEGVITIGTFTPAIGAANDALFNDVTLLIKSKGTVGTNLPTDRFFPDLSTRLNTVRCTEWNEKFYRMSNGADIATPAAGDSCFVSDLTPHTDGKKGVVYSETTAKFGTSSILFANETSWLQSTYVSGDAFGTGEFTIEAWINFWDLGLNFQAICNILSVNNNQFELYNDALGTNSGTAAVTLTYSINPLVTGTWHHVAVCRDASNIVRLFIDGTLEDSVASIASFPQPVYMVGAGLYETGQGHKASLRAFLQEIRVTKAARYTAGFTPPTLSFESFDTVLPVDKEGFIFDDVLLYYKEGRDISKYFVSTPLVQNSGSVDLVPFQISDGSFQACTKITGDAIVSLANAFGLNFQKNTFCVEFWVYLTDHPTATDNANTGNFFIDGPKGTSASLLNDWDYAYNNSYQVSTDVVADFGNVKGRSFGLGEAFSTFGNAVRAFRWVHIAYNRDSLGEVRVFVNGKLSDTPMFAYEMDADFTWIDDGYQSFTSALTSIGMDPANNLTGGRAAEFWLSELKITTTPKYFNNFTPKATFLDIDTPDVVISIENAVVLGISSATPLVISSATAPIVSNLFDTVISSNTIYEHVFPAVTGSIASTVFVSITLADGQEFSQWPQDGNGSPWHYSRPWQLKNEYSDPSYPNNPNVYIFKRTIDSTSSVEERTFKIVNIDTYHSWNAWQDYNGDTWEKNPTHVTPSTKRTYGRTGFDPLTLLNFEDEALHEFYGDLNFQVGVAYHFHRSLYQNQNLMKLGYSISARATRDQPGQAVEGGPAHSFGFCFRPQNFNDSFSSDYLDYHVLPANWCNHGVITRSAKYSQLRVFPVFSVDDNPFGGTPSMGTFDTQGVGSQCNYPFNVHGGFHSSNVGQGELQFKCDLLNDPDNFAIVTSEWNNNGAMMFAFYNQLPTPKNLSRTSGGWVNDRIANSVVPNNSPPDRKTDSLNVLYWPSNVNIKLDRYIRWVDIPDYGLQAEDDPVWISQDAYRGDNYDTERFPTSLAANNYWNNKIQDNYAFNPNPTERGNSDTLLLAWSGIFSGQTQIPVFAGFNFFSSFDGTPGNNLNDSYQQKYLNGNTLENFDFVAALAGNEDSQYRVWTRVTISFCRTAWNGVRDTTDYESVVPNEVIRAGGNDSSLRFKGVTLWHNDNTANPYVDKADSRHLSLVPSYVTNSQETVPGEDPNYQVAKNLVHTIDLDTVYSSGTPPLGLEWTTPTDGKVETETVWLNMYDTQELLAATDIREYWPGVMFEQSGGGGGPSARSGVGVASVTFEHSPRLIQFGKHVISGDVDGGAVPSLAYSTGTQLSLGCALNSESVGNILFDDDPSTYITTVNGTTGKLMFLPTVQGAGLYDCCATGINCIDYMGYWDAPWRPRWRSTDDGRGVASTYYPRVGDKVRITIGIVTTDWDGIATSNSTTTGVSTIQLTRIGYMDKNTSAFTIAAPTNAAPILSTNNTGLVTEYTFELDMFNDLPRPPFDENCWGNIGAFEFEYTGGTGVAIGITEFKCETVFDSYLASQANDILLNSFTIENTEIENYDLNFNYESPTVRTVSSAIVDPVEPNIQENFALPTANLSSGASTDHYMSVRHFQNGAPSIWVGFEAYNDISSNITFNQDLSDITQVTDITISSTSTGAGVTTRVNYGYSLSADPLTTPNIITASPVSSTLFSFSIPLSFANGLAVSPSWAESYLNILEEEGALYPGLADDPVWRQAFLDYWQWCKDTGFNRRSLFLFGITDLDKARMLIGDDSYSQRDSTVDLKKVFKKDDGFFWNKDYYFANQWRFLDEMENSTETGDRFNYYDMPYILGTISDGSQSSDNWADDTLHALKRLNFLDQDIWPFEWGHNPQQGDSITEGKNKIFHDFYIPDGKYSIGATHAEVYNADNSDLSIAYGLRGNPGTGAYIQTACKGHSNYWPDACNSRPVAWDTAAEVGGAIFDNRWGTDVDMQGFEDQWREFQVDSNLVTFPGTSFLRYSDPYPYFHPYATRAGVWYAFLEGHGAESNRFKSCMISRVPIVPEWQGGFRRTCRTEYYDAGESISGNETTPYLMLNKYNDMVNRGNTGGIEGEVFRVHGLPNNMSRNTVLRGNSNIGDAMGVSSQWRNASQSAGPANTNYRIEYPAFGSSTKSAPLQVAVSGFTKAGWFHDPGGFSYAQGTSYTQSKTQAMLGHSKTGTANGVLTDGTFLVQSSGAGITTYGWKLRGYLQHEPTSSTSEFVLYPAGFNASTSFTALDFESNYGKDGFGFNYYNEHPGHRTWLLGHNHATAFLKQGMDEILWPCWGSSRIMHLGSMQSNVYLIYNTDTALSTEIPNGNALIRALHNRTIQLLGNPD